jgi:hypothetical protein
MPTQIPTQIATAPHPVTENSELGRSAAVEQTVRIRASNDQLTCPGSRPVCYPKVNMNVCVVAGEQNSISEHGKVGDSQGAEQTG